MNRQVPEKNRMRGLRARTRIAGCLIVATWGALTGCAGPPSGPLTGARGVLAISFTFKESVAVIPSYQTAVWLEDQAGAFVASLFVTDYLAYGGFNLPAICSDWVRVSDWKNAGAAEFDAVTGATPPLGATTLTFDCATRGIRAGRYRYCIQTHVVEGYNIRYSGEIEIGGRANEGAGRVSYSPRAHEAARDILCDVRAVYRPPGSL